MSAKNNYKFIDIVYRQKGGDLCIVLHVFYFVINDVLHEDQNVLLN